MLKKQYRLRTNSSFVATYLQKQVVSDEFFSLYAGKIKKDEAPCRVGVVVSKKTNKRAVIRNKIKRHIREAYVSYLKEKGEMPYMSLVFKAKVNPLLPDYNITLKSVYKLADRLANKFI